MRDLGDATREELREFFAGLGLPRYRAEQVFMWIHGCGVRVFRDMTDLPAELRTRLAAEFTVGAPVLTKRLAAEDGTEKLVLRFSDGACVEAVVIPSSGRTTVCVSTQVGCRFGCRFCASGKRGFLRHLSAGEIAVQVEVAGRDVANVVFMGMGEPLDNLDNVMRAVAILNDGKGRNIGARRMTVSTAGVIPGIEAFARVGGQVRLSVSLHAADDKLRSRLMPLNRRYPLAELLAACRTYVAATGRRLTVEYVLLAGVNDRASDAEHLAGILKGLDAYVNLIPFSGVPGSGFRTPSARVVDAFAARLRRAGVNAVVRRSRGSEIRAACGQLAGTGL